MFRNFSVNRLFAQPQKVILVLAALMGLTMIVVAPPLGKVPDERSHFYRAYSVSQLHIVSQNQGGMLGGEIPRSFTSFKPPYLHQPLNANDTAFTRFDGAAIYSPVPYVPQAIGIGVGRLFNMPPMLIFYLARLCNLAAWLGLLYFSLKVAPKWAWAFGAIALLPICVFQSGTNSADVMTIGLSMLFVALIIRAATSTKAMLRNEYVTMFGVAILLGLTKPPLFLFTLAALAIPWKRFGSPKRAGLAIGALIAVTSVVAMSWNIFVRQVDVTQSFVQANPPVQLQEMIHHPGNFVTAMYNLHLYQPRSLTLVESVTTPAAWLGVWVLIWPVILSIVLILFGTFELSDAKIVLARRWQRLVVVGTAIVSFVAIDAILYLYFSAVNAPVVNGLQGRYYIPVIVLLIFAAKNRRVYVAASKVNVGMIVAVGSLVTFAVMALLIHQAYPFKAGGILH